MKNLNKSLSDGTIQLREKLNDITMNFKTQKEMFEYIWNTRDHISEVSGHLLLPKSHYKWHWQFAHILPKGSYPKYKLNPNNIMLMLPSEHEKQESFEKFIEKQDQLKREYYKEFYGKEF